MTSRERVQAALAHEETDRVPRLLYGAVIGYVPAIAELLERRCAPHSARDYFDMDVTGIAPNASQLALERYAPWYGERGEEAVTSGQLDEYGVWWRQGSYYHFAHIESPLKDAETIAELQAYPWPDLDAAYRYDGLKERVDALHEAGLAVAAMPGMVFEQSWYLRGMDNLLADMLTEPEKAHYLFDRTAYLQKAAAVELARAGADILITGDDVAMQTGLIMSLGTWREFLRPRLAETIAAAREAAPSIKVFYHSDGDIEPLIPELIDVGVDILNPVQPECMDPGRIKRQYGDRLSFWGTVSLQQTMAFGSADNVRAEVRERIRTVGKGGGLILAPAHVLGPEVPWENIVAFFEAADDAG